MKRTSALLSILVLTACGHAAPAKPVGVTLDMKPLAAHVAVQRAEEAAAAPAKSHLVATLESKAIGPFAAFAADAGVVVWIASHPRGGIANLWTVPLDKDGAPLGPARVAATVPQETTSLIVRPAGGTHGGWLAAWSALLDRGESLSVLGIAPDGTARGAVADIQRTSDHVKWLDVVPTASGDACVWAEQTPAGNANLLFNGLDTDGKPRGLPLRLARDVEGWAATPADGGVAFALVTPVVGSAGAGALSWLRVDALGRPLVPPVPISERPTVTGDVDLVATDAGWLFAWTDRTGEDPQVMLASVDKQSKLRGPRRAMDAVGGSSLLGLAAGPAGIALAWEEPRGRAAAVRGVHMASVTLDPQPTAQSVTSVDLAPKGTPELVATGSGFALLAPARVCRSAAPEVCNGPLVASAIVFDSRFMPSQTEPLLVGADRAEAALGWGLACNGDRCRVLAAGSDSPTSVYSVDLPRRASPFASPLTAALPADAPRVTGITTIASGAPYTDLAATRFADSTLVAMLTAPIDEGARRRRRSRGATLVVHSLDRQGQPTAQPTTMSARALSVGGVAMAAGGSPDDGVAIAWVARDDGHQQVHVGHLDRRGKRTGEVQLSNSKGDASDLAIAWAADGWLVAWADSRDGNGEVYSAKIDHDLQRVGHEQRITKAPGDASDVSIAVHDDVAWVAWSDSRESPREGLADIYTTTISPHDAKRIGDEIHVLGTAAHSRSPKLLATGEGALLGWVEDSPPELDSQGTALLVRLGADGHVMGAPSRLPLAGDGRPTALALGMEGGAPLLVLARSGREEVTLDAVQLSAAGAPLGKPWPLIGLDAPATFEVALALAGGALFYDDVGRAAGDHRVRRAAVALRR